MRYMSAVHHAAIIPLRLRRLRLMHRVPIVMIKHRDRWCMSCLAIPRPPSVRASVMPARIDTPLAEVFHTLAPFNDWETLGRRTSMQKRTLFFRRFESRLDRLDNCDNTRAV